MSMITSLESSNVLRNFVKVGISSIAYLRNLFAESVFEDTVIGGLQLKRLTRSIPESAALLDWIDNGVFDAMGHEYLKDLVLSIHNSQNVALESYTFSLKYGGGSGSSENISIESPEGKGASSDISVQISISNCSDDRNNPQGNVTVSADKEDVKQQTVKVLRDLVLMAQSLSPLPDNRYISMRLMYYDDRVPQDYEPQYFRSATSEEEAHVEAVNVEQQVGALETGHHNLSVDVSSCCYIDENVTNYKTCVRTFDTLTRRPAGMSSMKPYATNSLKRPTADMIMGPFDSVSAPDLKLPPLSGRSSYLQASTMKAASTNRNIILGLLKRGHELSMKTKYISKECLGTGLGIDTTLSKALLKKMMEYGYVDARFVKGRGYLSRCYESPSQKQMPLQVQRGTEHV